MNAEKEYKLWAEKLKNNEILSDQLNSISGNLSEINDRFSSRLSFGTAGARGLIGVGLNRINSVTIAHISSSYAEYLNEHFDHPSLVVSYDTRKYSSNFAKIASEVFSSNGIRVYFFKGASPIGLLSFAIRDLRCSGGVMITASHNPPEYNGYKIYDQNGGQPVDVREISSILESKNMFNFTKIDFNEAVSMGKITFVDENIENKYVESVKKYFEIDSVRGVNITYSPLHGCASKLFCKLFEGGGINVVNAQNVVDESFSTCDPPDPQKEKSFSLAIKEAKKHNSDLIILNDPDGDRLGIAVKNRDSYKILTGLEIASLILDFIINRENKKNICVIKSIVSIGLCDRIINFHKIKCVRTLPGFKYISEQIAKMETNGNLNSFIFGFEESNGFLLFPSVRDKDGISSSLFFCKMISYYKKNNLNCLDILENLYKKFGKSELKIISFKENDKSKINNIIDKFKEYFIKNELNVSTITDYRSSEMINLNSRETTRIKLDKSNIVEISFNDGSKFIARASGTEPLIKFYIYSC